MRTIKGFDPAKVQYEMSSLDAGRASIECVIGEFRYHIWVDPKTLKLSGDGILYKNPVKKSEYGRVPTRKLSASVGYNAELIEAMKQAVRDRSLIAAEHERLLAERHQQKLDNLEHARLRRIADASLQLYTALTLFRSLFKVEANKVVFDHERLNYVLGAADAALYLADKGTPVNTVQPGELTTAANQG